MVCNNCGKTYDDNMAFCPDCGTPASQQNRSEPVYQMPNYQMPNQQVYSEPPVTTGQYILWNILASLFGPISFIICIVFACMGENKNRANFFRARLVMWAIAIVLLIVCAMALSAIGTAILEEMDPYFYDEFLSLIVR